MGYFCKKVHDVLLQSDSDDAVSIFRDIQISFSDGSVAYNKVLLGILEPVVIDAMRGLNDLEDITIIYPDKSIQCLKELGKPQHMNIPCYSGAILELQSENMIEESTVPETNYCSLCDKNYSTKKQFRKHYYYKHYENGSNPPKRGGSLGRFRQTIQNMMVTGDLESITCSICEKSFKRMQGLTRHLETVHTPDVLTRFYCNFCDCSFNRKDNLLRHVSKAHPTQ